MNSNYQEDTCIVRIMQDLKDLQDLYIHCVSFFLMCLKVPTVNAAHLKQGNGPENTIIYLTEQEMRGTWLPPVCTVCVSI